MTARVTNEEIQALVDDSNTNCTQFIVTANILVNEILTSKGLSADRLKIIESYLAAHFYVITSEKGGMVRKKMGDAEERYQDMPSSAFGLASTRFGTQAAVLDTSGTLGNLTAMAVKARFGVI